jgi:hypothetical protein
MTEQLLIVPRHIVYRQYEANKNHLNANIACYNKSAVFLGHVLALI